MKPSVDWSLYLVTDRVLAGNRPLEAVVAAAVRGGVTVVQLREKALSTRAFVHQGLRIRAITQAAGIPLIINDRLDVALAVDAEGVHLGQADMPFAAARRILGPDKLIGLSVETEAQAEWAQSLDLDYLGVSPIYRTPTKTELLHAFGIEGLRRVRRLSHHPLVAIGGINGHTLPDVIRTGIEGVAVVSAICAASDPEAAARTLATGIRNARKGFLAEAMQERMALP